MFRMYDLIQKKKHGESLTKAEIDYMIKAYTAGDIPDAQMSAFCMAVYFKGMDKEETANLTMAMVDSGDTIDLSGIEGFKVDKHSTGGVGDKTSFIIMSIVASLGIKVPKMSGRGLGHTGGTLDKAEAIENFTIEMTFEKFMDNVRAVGAALAGQTGDLAPADKKLYALRDVTGTVDNLSLISASIMSKKIASGADGIVLDVKTGSGAFMKTLDDSIALAKAMVDIGVALDKKMSALITNMDIPTGYAIGNALEIKEVIAVLKGGGPEDLRTICLELAANMVYLATDASIEDCRVKVLEQLNSGGAFDKFVEIVAAQSGNVEQIKNPDLLPQASVVYEVLASETGYMAHMDAEKCGLASGMLGAARQTVDDVIDYSAGIVLVAKTGDYVKTGDVMAYLHTNDEALIGPALATFLSGVVISQKKPEALPLIFARVTKDEIVR